MTKTHRLYYTGLLCALGLLFVLPILEQPAQVQDNTAINYGTESWNNTLDLDESIREESPISQEDSVPHLLSRYNFEITNARAVFIENNRLYCIDSVAEKVIILNITNPGQPNLLGSFSASDVTQDDLFVLNQIAYVPTAFGFDIWNCTDPSVPSLLGIYSNTTVINDIAISNNIAYVTGHEKLYIVNVSNPYSPTYINHFTGSFDEIAIKENTLFTLDYSHTEIALITLNVFNISDLTNQSGSLKSISILGYANSGDICIEEDVLVVSQWFDGIYTYNITDPQNIMLMDHYGVLDWDGNQIAFENQIVYAADSQGNVLIYNLANPLDITELTPYTGDGVLGNDLEVKEGIIYLADGSDGIEIIDSHIREGAKDSDNDGLFDIDEILYWNTDPLISDSDFDGCPDGIEIEIGTDPNNFNGQWLEPEIVGTYTHFILYFRDIAIKQNFMYVVTEEGGLEVYKILPTEPQENGLSFVMAYAPNNYDFSEIKILDDLLFIYSENSVEFEIYNISNAANPAYLTTYTASNNLNDLFWDAQMERIYLATDGSIEILDCTNLLNPNLIANITNANVRSVYVIENHLIYTFNDLDWAFWGVKNLDISNLENPVV
ncbi:MAG: hypothetical protein ACTSYI_16380, partial [Promethearchaeota archaeon]